MEPPRKIRFSLRARATSWYVGLMAVALLVFSFAIYLGVRTYLKVTLQRALGSTAHTIAADYLTKLGSKGYPWVLGEIRESYDNTPSDHYIRLTSDGRVLYTTDDMRDPAIPLDRIPLFSSPDAVGGPRSPLIGDILIPRLAGEGQFYRRTVNHQTLLIYVLPVRVADGKLIQIEAGASLYSMQHMLTSLARVLAGTSVVILLFAGIGGYVLMKRPLRPLVVLTEKAANIGRKRLGERLPVPDTGDELERLTHSLNGMIDRLEDALDHNRRFSADASHELRTPLTIMRGELEEMLQMEGLPPQVVENLVSILDESERMSRIVNSLMTITRLDAGGERMAMQPVDLAPLVRTTMEHMRLLAEEKGLALTCKCEDGMYVYADPMRVKQIVVNLVDNAIKYSNPDREARRGAVEVKVYATDSAAVLQVADDGIGISPEALPHVFDRFYRADSSRSRGAGGVGLGLAIVKAIVTAHDGSVSLKSTLGQGSIVTVELPLLHPQDAIGVDDTGPERVLEQYQES
ncbi:MAG TPA: HAMP domain-containing sensor histidine kinase [Acidobacteriaceae bacterium]|nr:HAMP domain-containing sensor histidine kinase [Acidobacteriaceae bacterium]